MKACPFNYTKLPEREVKIWNRKESLFGVVTSFIIGSISIPMIVLLILIILDYILGILAAVKEEKKFDASKAIWGAVKKVGYAIVILFGILVDMLLLQGINEIGLNIPWPAVFSIAATVYLCGISSSLAADT